MEGTGPWWLVPSSHGYHRMLPALTSDSSKEFYLLEPWLPRNLSGRPAAEPTFSGALPKRKPPSLFGAGRGARCGPAPGEQLSLGGGGGGGAAPLCGQRRAASIAARRGASPRGANIQRAGVPSPSPSPSPPLLTPVPGAFISHPGLVPQIHRPWPRSPSSLAGPQVTTGTPRSKLSPRQQRGGAALRPTLVLPFAAPGTPPPEPLKTKAKTATFHTPFPPRAATAALRGWLQQLASQG